MTLTDALNRASVATRPAREEDGFCVLRRPGFGIAARGSSWDEAFARLEAVEGARPARKEPDVMPPPEPGRLF